jgi:hypothetical protein
VKAPLSPELKAKILESAQSRPSPTRGDERKRLFWVTLLGFVLVLPVGLLLRDAPVDHRARALMLGTVLGTLTLAAFAWLSIARGRSMVGPSRIALWLLGLSAPVALFIWKVWWSARFSGALAASPRIGFRCLALTLAVGAVPLLVALFRRRRTEPTHPHATGFALGAAAGLLGAVSSDAWCPIGYVPHFLVGHVLPVALLAAVGMLIGARLLVPRN